MREIGAVGKHLVVPNNDWSPVELPVWKTKGKEAVISELTSQSTDCWVVSVLRCADATLSTGITNDLLRRIGQHSTGTASRYTRSRRPVALADQEIQPDRSMALKRELAIKALSRKAKVSLILAAN